MRLVGCEPDIDWIEPYVSYLGHEASRGRVGALVSHENLQTLRAAGRRCRDDESDRASGEPSPDRLGEIRTNGALHLETARESTRSAAAACAPSGKRCRYSLARDSAPFTSARARWISRSRPTAAEASSPFGFPSR